MTSSRGISLDEIVAHFQDLEDSRSSINRRYPLVAVIVIAVLGVLAGASGPTVIAEWAAIKEEVLVAALGLPAGVPGKDVFRRVLMALQPATFQKCFIG
jgi:DDE family transposase